MTIRTLDRLDGLKGRASRTFSASLHFRMFRVPGEAAVNVRFTSLREI